MELCCTEAACSTLLTATGSRLTTSWGGVCPDGLVQGWLLSPGLAVGAEEAGGGGRSLVSSQAETRGQPRLRKRGGRPGLALGSVLSASGQALNQEGREARAGPDLLGAAFRILAS